VALPGKAVHPLAVADIDLRSRLLRKIFLILAVVAPARPEPASSSPLPSRAAGTSARNRVFELHNARSWREIASDIPSYRAAQIASGCPFKDPQRVLVQTRRAR
jgi:hypothetical protein